MAQKLTGEELRLESSVLLVVEKKQIRAVICAGAPAQLLGRSNANRPM